LKNASRLDNEEENNIKDGTLSLPCQILVVSASPDDPAQHVSLMNAIFTAQKMGVRIDVVRAYDDSVFLSQAAHLTGGVYIRSDTYAAEQPSSASASTSSTHSDINLNLSSPNSSSTIPNSQNQNLMSSKSNIHTRTQSIHSDSSSIQNQRVSESQISKNELEQNPTAMNNTHRIDTLRKISPISPEKSTRNGKTRSLNMNLNLNLNANTNSTAPYSLSGGPCARGLAQLLIGACLPSPLLRNKMHMPILTRVDFRAACRCHSQIVDTGHVCSACLAIYCSSRSFCDACRTVFT
jgi:Transcription factor Tfb4